jgi:hypothetical protein
MQLVFPLSGDVENLEHWTDTLLYSIIRPIDDSDTPAEYTKRIISDIRNDPYLVLSVYEPTTPMYELRKNILESPYSCKIQHTFATYRFSKLEPVQIAYIEEFLDILMDQFRSDQNKKLIDFDFENFKPRRDLYPFPKSTIVNKSVAFIILDKGEDDYYLTFSYDEPPGEESVNIPAIEVHIHVYLDDDDIPTLEESDLISSDDNGYYVIFEVTLNLCD